MKETSLYYPVRELLQSQGFAVKGEVKDIDILAVKDGMSVAVELKTAISLKLVLQAIERQKYCDKVYVALPKEVLHKDKGRKTAFMMLLRRLLLGLIAVGDISAEIIIEATEIDETSKIRASRKKKEAALTEFSQRHSDANIGGSKGITMTRYREKVVAVARALRVKKIATPTEVALVTGFKDAGKILMQNYYGWFERLERGLYRLSPIGETEAFSNDEGDY